MNIIGYRTKIASVGLIIASALVWLPDIRFSLTVFEIALAVGFYGLYDRTNRQSLLVEQKIAESKNENQNSLDVQSDMILKAIDDKPVVMTPRTHIIPSRRH